jgi:hypothetical protein
MKTALMLAAMSLWSLSSLAMNPPLDVDTLTSVMEKVKAKQEKKPVPCVCQDGSGAAGLVATASSAPGNYRQSCRYFIFPGNGMPPIPVICTQFAYIPK